MAFRRALDVKSLKGISYNSKEAKDFLNFYSSNVQRAVSEENQHVPSRTFAPSSFRCKRQQWFRLRGTKPDASASADVALNFIANVGTHCHEQIQKNLSEFLEDDWLNVKEYLLSNPPKYKYSLKQSGYETRVSVENPPVKFSCDGLVRVQGKVYLLEVKTSELNSMKLLVAPKQEHLDQVKCYCTLLGVQDAFVLYQDRQYGSLKCFTYHLTDSDKSYILNNMEYVLDCVKRNLVPDPLPSNDKWCSSSYCKYYATCKKWGR